MLDLGFKDDVEKIYEYMEEYGLAAIIITNPESMKYLGYDMWFDSVKEWMTRSGGSNNIGSSNMCVVPLKEKPVYILSSFSLSFSKDNHFRILPYGKFFDPGNGIDHKFDGESKKIFNILSGDVFDDPYEALDHALSDLDLKQVRLAVEYDGINFSHKKAIDNKLKNCEILNDSEILRLARMIKTEEEISLIKKCFEITEKSFLETVNLIASGVRLKELHNSFKESVGKDGATVQHLSLMQRGLGMTENSEYRFDSNMIMGLDAGITYRKYISDTGLTVFWGSFSDSELQIYKKLLSIIEAGFSSIKPGVRCLEVYKKMLSKSIEQNINNAIFEGHGVGLNFREYPFINGNLEYQYNNGFNDISANFIIEESMIINLEIGCHFLGKKTFQIEQTILVTVNGAEPIVMQDRDLPISIE